MNFPSDLRYSKEHEWVKVDGATGTVGITDFAQKELGDIVFVEVNSIGKTVPVNEVFGTIEAVKTVSDLFMPLTGKVIEKNAALDSAPESVNNDPYHSGWLVKIEIANPAELDELMDAEAYKQLIGM